MTSEEFGAFVFLGVYALMLLGAIKVWGLRRVLGVIFGIVFLGVVIAMKTLGAITTDATRRIWM